LKQKSLIYKSAFGTLAASALQHGAADATKRRLQLADTHSMCITYSESYRTKLKNIHLTISYILIESVTPVEVVMHSNGIYKVNNKWI